MLSDVQQICADLQRVRTNAPLVHNITNFVVMNNTANALLAIGASPVMAHALEEVADMTTLASALVINIGTLSTEWIAAMELTMKTAKNRHVPIVFDPVGAGATPFRTNTSLHLLEQINPSVIRGNASEIMALAGAQIQTKGVDSAANNNDAAAAAAALAQRYSCSVCASGAVDLITDGKRTTLIYNGHPLMPRVTGLGCSASALTGAFCAVNQDYFAATVHAMAVLGICGEIAARQANGPGTLQLHILDALYNLTDAQIETYLEIKTLPVL